MLQASVNQDAHSEESTQSLARANARWSHIERFLFLFLSLYLLLSTCFWVFEFSDKTTALIGRPYIALWRPIVRFFTVHAAGWRGPIELNFVRDTRYLYAQLACFVLVSALSAMVGTIADRSRTEYNKLHGWMRVFLRYVLAYLMLHYGMDKVFLIQFPAPGLARLVEPFGDYSPSSLMWAFIGSSVSYTIFGGLAEIAGALLLLARRTALLGALLVFAVMFNVTVMDFSYDVSVKLFCLNLLLMAGFLIYPDASRLLSFFVLNRETRPSATHRPEIPEGRKRIAGAVKFCVVLYLLVPLTWRDWKTFQESRRTTQENQSGLAGLYDVSEFATNGDIQHGVQAKAATKPADWRFIAVDSPKTLVVRRVDDSVTTYSIVYDAELHQVHLLGSSGMDAGSLTLTAGAAGQYVFTGNVDGVPLTAVTHRVDRFSFPLVNRGFHWINESSYVR